MEAIWPGSGSGIHPDSGSTPFGLYDSDSTFQTDGPKFAKWCAQRLGYPIMAIELQDIQFYACFEEAVTEYSAQVNQFNIRENLLSLRGQATGSTNNVTHKRVTPNLSDAIRISEQYGSEAGVGGTIDFKSGSISVNSGSQVYDLNKLIGDVSESGKAIEIRKVFYEATPAVQRYFDPYAGTGAGTYEMLDGFGFGGMTPAVQFMMMPVYADVLRMQAIEFNDHMRKSAHTFELINNKLRIFPNPTDNYKLWFQYILKEDRDNPMQTQYSGSANVVSDYSNVPYNNMEYQFINDVGKQWIRKYGLALTKELLGMIRSKYGSIPVPNAETTLDGDTLRTEAQTEKEFLVTQLRENLEASSRKMMLEADSEEATRLQEKLNKVPLPIYIG
jgi:hypothetical protein|tara:strand:+ start:1688 stop:2851 length:1164 start_codon:yes stop_codon:yes gene_type:complete